MNYKIICDSGASLYEIKNENYESIPLKVISKSGEFEDVKGIDIENILDKIEMSGEKSTTSCPNVNNYLNAFSKDENIFVITITSALSGSYNSAVTAAKISGIKNIHVIDSLSAGPKMQLIAEKIIEYAKKDYEFDQICEKIEKYKKRTHLLFNIKNLNNLANNGRISQSTAKLAGLMGISLIGKSDSSGKINCIEKSRGDKRSMKKIVKIMKDLDYKNGKIKILHCLNPEAASYLSFLINSEFSQNCVKISEAGLICSYYGQKGTVMIGFESGDFDD